jgi:hypothetical protein
MRAKIQVEVDTDQVPGWGYDPKDYVDLIQKYLNEVIPHYNPKVTLQTEKT